MISDKERREVTRKLLALAEEMIEMFRIGGDTDEGLDAKWCQELHDIYDRRLRKVLRA